MIILFSAKIKESFQKDLQASFPNQHFIFWTSHENFLKNIPKAHVVVTYGEDLEQQKIQMAENLQWIMVLSAGMERLPFAEIAKRNILVTNVKGIHKIPMSEYAISMLLQYYRQEKLLIRHEAEAIWDKSVTMQEISGRHMLIVGTGAIGQEVARLAKAFRIKTYGVSRSGQPVEYVDEMYTLDTWGDVLPKVDIIISILPSTEETRGLYTYRVFQNMKREALFLNMGRGDAVIEADLLKAIQNEEIAHAILDVFDEEPLPKDHPFWSEPNITVTSHLSGVSTNYVPRALDIFKENLSRYLKSNKPYINEIDPKKGY